MLTKNIEACDEERRDLGQHDDHQPEGSPDDGMGSILGHIIGWLDEEPAVKTRGL